MWNTSLHVNYGMADHVSYNIVKIVGADTMAVVCSFNVFESLKRVGSRRSRPGIATNLTDRLPSAQIGLSAQTKTASEEAAID